MSPTHAPTQHNRNQRTNENIPDTRRARARVREPRLVALEAREADRHLGHDVRQHCTETLVQRERGLTSHDHGAGRDEATGLGLEGR